MKQYIPTLLAAGLAVLCSLPVEAGNIDPIPASQSNPEAKVWTSNPDKPALMEALSRTPGSNYNEMLAASPFKALPIKGQVLRNPQSQEAMAGILKAPQRVMPGGTNLTAFLAFNTLDKEVGFYSVPITNSIDFVEQSTLPTIEMSGFHGGAVTPNYEVLSYQGIYTENGEYSGYTAIIDRRNWQVLGNQGDYGQYGRWATDMTYDPTTNRIYGCFMTDDAKSWELGFMQIDDNMPASAVNTVRKVNKLETSLNGIASDEYGVLWGIRSSDGALVNISRKTGEMTFVAHTGIVPRYNGTLTWDMSRHILYWALCYDDGDAVRSALCTVDPVSGQVEYLNIFAGNTAQLGALGADFAAQPGAPAQPTNMSVNIAGFDYSGTVTFNVPAKLENNSSASGNVQAVLKVTNAANRTQAYTASVNTRYGNNGVSIPVELENAGNYIFTVTLVNAAGESYPATVTRYVGIDYPGLISNVDLQCANGKLTVTWPAVTEPLNGGYFNPDELVYKVIVQKTDAKGQTATLYNDNTASNRLVIDVENTTDLRAYRANVTPICSEVAGQPLQTRWKWFGYYSAPFSDTMKTAGAWTTETIYGSDWYCSSSGWAIPYVWGLYNNSWLFSPAVMLQKGEIYNISVDAYAEVVAHTGKIALGRAAMSDSMTVDLCNISVTPKRNNKYEAVFACNETGIYYFGILNDTRSDTWTNYPDVEFNNFKVEAVSKDAPAAPEMVVSRDPNGGYVVPVKVTVPSKTHGGANLSGNLSLVVKRDGKEIYSKESVNTGDVVEFNDTVTKDGSYIYMAYAVNEVAEGAPAISTMFIGAGLPVNPEWVRHAEGDSVGVVNVEWSPVTVNTQGMEIASSAIKYNVMNVLGNVYIQRGVTDTKLSYRACNEGEQEGVYVSVNAETNSGQSSTYGTYTQNGISFVGTPAQMPMRETFDANSKLSVPWLTVNQSSGADGFTVANMMDKEGIMDANGDGQALMGFCPYLDGSVALYSGMIEVPEDANAPAFHYAVLNTNFGSDANDNANIVSIYIIGEKTSGLIDQYEIKSMPLGWNYRYIDLGALKGERVHIMIMLNTKSYTTYYFDDICLYDRVQTDVKVNSISVAPEVQPGARINISVKVMNNGMTNIDRLTSAKIELLRGDQVIANGRVPAMRTLENANLTFTDRLQLADAPGATYTARVVFDDDMVNDNNEMSATTKIALPNVPVPTDLQGDRDTNGYPQLAWTAPDLTPAYEATTAYFEGFQGYSLVHLDGFSTFELTGNAKDISNFETAHGFELYYHPQLSHSGSCFLMSAACIDGASKEDWLVSPLLSGRAQTVSFYVSTNWNAHENFYVYASATGDSREDFGQTPVYTGRTLSNNWQKVTVDLPEGTKHFAIVAKAEDTSALMMLMIDDVVYEGMPANANLELKGYRLYRDRESIAEDPLQGLIHTDTEAEVGGHLYRVTALYDGIESAPTEEVYVFSRGGAPESGIESIELDGVVVSTEPGLIKIEAEGEAAVRLYDYSGRAIFDGTADHGTLVIPVRTGAYVLSINDTSMRIMVK